MRTFCTSMGLASVLLLGSVWAHAAAVSKLLGQTVNNERGEPAGKIEDLIVDVREGRILYLVVAAGDRYRTFPVRALGDDLRLDRRLSGETANLEPSSDPRFRRAGKLIGQTVTHPHAGGSERVGTISDIEFDSASGKVEHVTVATGEGKSQLPPEVLRHGRFPPLTQWKGDYIDSEDIGERGYVRRPPSSERRRLHDHQW